MDEGNDMPLIVILDSKTFGVAFVCFFPEL